MTFSIETYDPKFDQAFYDLNAEWVEEFFEMEPIDQTVLSDPKTHIIDKGGEIFYAVENGKAVGAIAMKLDRPGRYELTKLGVDKSVRKAGVGATLCKAVIDCFQARQGETLFLETNTVLEPAIRLYWKLGFVEMPNPVPSPYERSNYYMEWQEGADR